MNYPRNFIVALTVCLSGALAQAQNWPAGSGPNGNYRVGFLAVASDYVIWDYNASRWGMYDVEIT